MVKDYYKEFDVDKNEVFGKASSSKSQINVAKESKKILKQMVDNNHLIKTDNGYDIPLSKEVSTGLKKIYNDSVSKVGNCVIEVADGNYRIRKVQSDLGSPVVEFADMQVGNLRKGEIIETADSNENVIGIPYTIANVGADKYYVVNGRVYTGWSMWYGMNAIYSPEDYARNVDLAYNVPFVWAGFQLKAQLSLGASFEIVHGSDEEITPEENLVNETLFGKLNINQTKLMKTSFHLDTYGNAYWHIRRDNRGFPDKVTILQPERIKVFLDPRTTKILYYIYLPPILAGMTLTPYPNLRENPNIMTGPALTYPSPIIIDPQDIIHFKENNYTEYPFGMSSVKAMLDPCQARMDINLIAPMIFKRYAKPFVHWKLDPKEPFQLSKGQIESYIAGMKETLQNMDPMSDPITTTRWSATMMSAAQGKAELLTILQDLDNQIFSVMNVPQAYFKGGSGSDRMIMELDKTFMAGMAERQEMVRELINDNLVKPIINKMDQYINPELVKQGGQPIVRGYRDYPDIQWRETFKQDQATTIQNTMALLQAGIIDHSRAARRVGEAPPSESEELTRQMDIKKIMEESQIAQGELAYLQSQLQIMQTQAVMQNGGVIPPEMGGEGNQEGGSSGGSKKSSSKDKDKKITKKDKETAESKNLSKIDENSRYRVTFQNRTGKKQTEVMKGSTLKDRRKGGLNIVSVQPVSSANQAQDQVNKTV